MSSDRILCIVRTPPYFSSEGGKRASREFGSPEVLSGATDTDNGGNLLLLK